MGIRQITIVGAGLMGGSLALALKKYGFKGAIVGCDRAPVLRKAIARHIVDGGHPDPVSASQGSDIVVLATPVAEILRLIDALGPRLSATALLTDVGSTKVQIMARASGVFGRNVRKRFLGGHPMAGKETSGISECEPDLFVNMPWLFTPYPGQALERGLAADFIELVRGIGARVSVLDAEQHDHVCAWVSHLPQMISTALAASVIEHFGENAIQLEIAGKAFREMTRTAASSSVMWADIADSNRANLREAMEKFEARLARLRELRPSRIRTEFQQANRLSKRKAR